MAVKRKKKKLLPLKVSKRKTAKRAPVAKRKPAKRAPVAKRKTAKRAPVAKRKTAKRVPVAKRKPAKRVPVAKRKPAKRVPVAKRKPAKRVPVAKRKPAKRAPVAKHKVTPKITRMVGKRKPPPRRTDRFTGAFAGGFPEGFAFQYDPNLLTEDKVLIALKRQIKNPTYKQQRAAVRLWQLGDQRSDTQERLFAALLAGHLIDELDLIADEEKIPDGEKGSTLTFHFFSP
jgi:hypothetical protein